MKFFVPHAETQDASERIYLTIKECAQSAAGHISDRRIFRIEFMQTLTIFEAEVGKNIDFREVDDEVMAIFESESLGYLIYTPSRGVDSETFPIIVPVPDAMLVEDFEV